MLKLLNISNLAIVDRLQVEFQTGLNVMSGETGSGKSIVIDALGFLLGNRVTHEIIRSGETKAFVEGIFASENNQPLRELLEHAGIELEDDEIVIKREFSAGGRGRIFINNQSATLALLKEIQPHVIDIHGQGDQQSLLTPENHLRIYDAYIGVAELRGEVEQLHEELVGILRIFAQAQQSEAERLQKLDLIQFQLTEIEKLSARAGEDVELEEERRRLANAEKLATLCGDSYRQLYEDEQSILAQLASVQRRLNELCDVDKSFVPHLEQLTGLKYSLEDTAYFIRDYSDNIEVSPQRLHEVDQRIVELDRIKRKYGGTLDAVLEAFADLSAKRDALQFGEERSEQLKNELAAKLQKYETLTKKLTQKRQAKAAEFEKAALGELAQVAIENARFSLRFQPAGGDEWHDLLRQLLGRSAYPALSRNGREQLEFYFSANKGEELHPLRDVASGGELSRLMLVLKTITAPTQFPRTLIFDEIDTGIGGRVADAVGLRLHRLAATNQVLCVTHQAQIARYADTHHLVSKGFADDRTTTSITPLDHNGQVEELARMLAGNEITATARKHARELLKAK